MHLRSIALAAALAVGGGPWAGGEEAPKDVPRPPPSPVDGGSAADAAPPGLSQPPRDLDVVLITIDCLRADMPWAGYERPIAPRLTELATRAVQFTRAYSMSSYTSMSLGGLLGGRLPGEMHRDGYFFGVYAKENVLFPEILQNVGIH